MKTKRRIEFIFNAFGAKATALVGGKKLEKIEFAVKVPSRFYASFMNDALLSFYEKYPQYN